MWVAKLFLSQQRNYPQHPKFARYNNVSSTKVSKDLPEGKANRAHPESFLEKQTFLTLNAHKPSRILRFTPKVKTTKFLHTTQR